MESAIDFAMKKAGVIDLKEKQKECLQWFLEGHDAFWSLVNRVWKNFDIMVSLQRVLLCPDQSNSTDFL